MTSKTLHPHSAAAGLASLGRHGDTTLVHMSPKEVQGLQTLAQAHGTSLTINPHTGMPEAFSLGKLLPLLAGAAVGIMAPAALPWIAAGTAGVKKASGSSWADSIGTGLQVYGGGSLASGLASAGAGAAQGATGATQSAVEGAKDVVPTATDTVTNAVTPVEHLGGGYDAAGNLVTQPGPGIGVDSSGEYFATDKAQGLYRPEISSFAPQATAPAAPPQFNLDTAAGRWDAAKAGGSSMKGWGQAFGDTNTAAKAGLVSTAMDVAKDNAAGPQEHKPVYYITDPKTGKPLYSAGTINPNVAKLGYIPAGEQAFTGQGFNEGVYSYSPTEYKPVPGMRSGGLASLTHYDSGGTVAQSKGQQILATNAPMPAPQQGANQAALQGMNQYYANQLGASQAVPSQMNQPAPSPQANADWMTRYNQMIGVGAQPTAPQTNMLGDGTTPSQAADPLATAAANYDAAQAAKAAEEKDGSQVSTDRFGNKYNPSNTFEPFGNDRSSQHMATGGLAGLSNDYAAGGKLLRGPGDGMSDSIPAVIGGQKPQRAALADGEFVVPADVVSHLGNGSTEAGSRKLYAMMDKIRHARTGKKKQAPAVKAERYMPA